MADDPVFHFPPDVFEAVVNTVPLLVRGKRDVLTFYQGCGVSRPYLDTLEPWTRKESGYSNYHIARQVVTHLNETGDAAIGTRRQLIKRVADSEDFSGSWPDDRLKARGAVATLAELVGRKDSFTRIQEERDREQRAHQAAKRLETQRLTEARRRREQVKTDLYRLFGDRDPQRRGKALEGVLNRLFQTHDILVREAFVVTGDSGEGVIEQIDGSVEIDGHLYLVEMKWWDKPLGRNEVSLPPGECLRTSRRWGHLHQPVRLPRFGGGRFQDGPGAADRDLGGTPRDRLVLERDLALLDLLGRNCRKRPYRSNRSAIPSAANLLEREAGQACILYT